MGGTVTGMLVRGRSDLAQLYEDTMHNASAGKVAVIWNWADKTPGAGAGGCSNPRRMVLVEPAPGSESVARPIWVVRPEEK